MLIAWFGSESKTWVKSIEPWCFFSLSVPKTLNVAKKEKKKRLSKWSANTSEQPFIIYLLHSAKVLLLGKCKSSWYNLDWFAFKSFEMTVQLLLWCRSLTTEWMHLMNNLTMQFISVELTLTVKCIYSLTAPLINTVITCSSSSRDKFSWNLLIAF